MFGKCHRSVQIVVFDPVNVGYSHAMFNAAMVRALDAVTIVGGVDLLIAASSLQSRAFGNVLALRKVRVEGALPERSKTSGRVREAKRALGCYIQLWRSLGRKRDAVCILLASDNLVGPVWLLFYRWLRGGGAHVILHNNAHGIQKSAAVRRLWRRVFRSGVRAIVLAKTVEEFYRAHYPEVPFNFMPHPSYEGASGVREREQEAEDHGCRFLFLGRHGRSSTTVDFLGRFIETCAEVGAARRISICVEQSVGVHFEVIARSAGIGMELYDWPVGHDEYYRMVRAAHFVVFPPEGSKRITASGVQADAISCRVPIIGPAQGVFRENVAESGLSFLYEDVAADLERVVSRATTMSRTEYERLRSDLVQIRRDGDVIRTAQRLANLVGTVSE